MSPELLMFIQAIIEIIDRHLPPGTTVVLTKEEVADLLATQIRIGDANLEAAFAELGIEVPE